MSKNTALMLVVGFVAGCGAAAAAPLLIPPAHAQTSQRWESFCVYRSEAGGQALATELTAVGTTAGREGWELVSMSLGTQNHSGTACFKRPAP